MRGQRWFVCGIGSESVVERIEAARLKSPPGDVFDGNVVAVGVEGITIRATQISLEGPETESSRWMGHFINRDRDPRFSADELSRRYRLKSIFPVGGSIRAQRVIELIAIKRPGLTGGAPIT